VVGHDGWLYLALGDRGCDVSRPEGDRLVLNGGGILRCRPDGSDLHVFSTGLRNIYDIALDDELNVFVRDNENDGGTYMIRLCHSFVEADHGYPYLYYEHPDIIETKDGRTLDGIVTAESAASLTLKRAEGLTETMLRRDIVQLTGSGLSLMPEGLETAITVEQMADLIAFLLFPP